MRVHRLLLENFKGIEFRELEFPDAGVIVLEGPNEIGKSSTLEALDLLLNEKHTAKKLSVLATKPVHRDCATRVEADISSGPYRFVLTKQWHARPGAELRVLAPHAEQFTGDAAHARVRAILDETLDTGLWNALRILQGAEPDTSLAGSSALATALDSAAGSAEATPDSPDGAESLLEAAAVRAGEFWTAGGRPTGRLRTARQELAAAQERATSTAAALAELSAEAERYARLSRGLLEAEDRTRVATTELAGAETAGRALDGLRAAVRTSTERRELLQRSAVEATAARERRRRAEADVATRTAQVAADAERLAARRPVVQELAGRLDQAERAAADARTRAELTRVAADAARETLDRTTALRDLSTAGRRLTELTEAVTVAEAAGAALAGPAVDEATYARLQALCAAADLARARLQSASARVHVEATAVGVDLTLAGRTETIAAGTAGEREASGDLLLDVAGFARVRIVPGADARTLADAAARADLERDEALAAAGVADLDEARTACAQHREAQQNLRAAIAQLDRLTRSGSLEQARAEYGRLLASVDGSADVTAGTPVGEEELRAARAAEQSARAADRAAHEEVRATTEAVTRLVREHEQSVRAVSALEAALHGGQAELDRATSVLVAARAEVGDDDLDRAADRAGQQLADAAAATTRAAEELAAHDPDGVAARLTQSADALRRSASARDELAERRRALRSHLDYVGALGLQAEDDAARTLVTRLTTELDGVTRRAEAAALLHTTLLRHRQSARRRYVTPFTRRLVALGAEVFGPDFAVELDEDLRIVSRTLDGRVVPWKDLSTGAREQLAVLTRLACAEIVDPADGVPVVLDDALGHSDPDRVRRLGAVLAKVGPTAQVIVLSPGPALREAVPSAHVIRLDPEAVRTATAAAVPATRG